jgi:hypothetical protein
MSKFNKAEQFSTPCWDPTAPSNTPEGFRGETARDIGGIEIQGSSNFEVNKNRKSEKKISGLLCRPMGDGPRKALLLSITWRENEVPRYGPTVQ